MKEKNKIALLYHEIFNYKLSKEELIRWKAGRKLKLVKAVRTKDRKINFKSYSPHGDKLIIASKTANLIQKIPSVLFVGITGSLAMNNANEASDIDLMIITKADSLWLTRLLTICYLRLTNQKVRKPRDSDEKDRICLNLWLDEKELVWSGPRNAYIAHEIAQVVPLVNINKTYQRWVTSNSWITDYWPNAVKKNIEIRRMKQANKNSFFINLVFVILNAACYLLQKLYMSPKITRETVTLHKAFFHPYDWGEKVLKELRKRGVVEV